MTERISKRDVEQAFISATHAARAAGLNTEGWAVSHGSPLNGISWTLSTGQRGAAAVHVGSFDHIGSTAREAWRTLRTLEAAWRAVATAQETGYGWTGDTK